MLPNIYYRVSYKHVMRCGQKRPQETHTKHLHDNIWNSVRLTGSVATYIASFNRYMNLRICLNADSWLHIVKIVLSGL